MAKRTRMFPDMTKLLPATERAPGRFYIEHIVVDAHASRMSAFRRRHELRA